jgi:predicted amidohydrolase YtcJ
MRIAPTAGVTLLFALLAAAPARLIQETDRPPDLALVSGRIVTMDAARPTAEAVAIRDGRILFVGSTAHVTTLKGPKTRVIDLRGMTVVPGLVDGHLHFANLAGDARRLDLGEAKSEAEAAEAVRRAAARAQPGDWILGSGWHTGNWARETWPTRASLDAAAPNHPVLLAGMHGHASWANSRALAAAAVTRETTDPPGGKLLRDASGEPTGIFIENAQALVRGKVPPQAGGSLKDRIKAGVRLALSYGFTGAHDMGTSLETIEAYKELIAAGEFPFRINAYPRVVNAGALLDQILAAGRYEDPGLRLQVRAVKVSIDGALGARGAALMAPYSDDPSNLGVIRVPYDQLYLIVEKSLKAGFTLAIHAIGDRGNQMALDAVEQALAGVGSKDHRIRIEHAQVLRPADVPRFAELGLVTSWQWMHGTLDMPWAEKRVGAARIRTSYAWRTLLATGARLVGGSDEGARTFSPFMGIHAAVTRQDSASLPAGGWYPGQRLTREEALRSYTVDPAYVAFQEARLGVIGPGRLADLAVLSKDILTVPERDILATEAVMTLVGGEIVYERPATTPSARR